MGADLIKAGVVNRRVRLDQLQFAGHNNVAKTLQEWVIGQGVGEGFSRPVGEPEQRHIGLVQRLENRHAVG